MGVEYHISCSPDRLPRLAEFLLRIGGQRHPQSSGQIGFSFGPAAPDSAPDATVVVEPERVYFCDHGGPREAAAVLFRRIVDEALALSDGSDTITITAL